MKVNKEELTQRLKKEGIEERYIKKIISRFPKEINDKLADTYNHYIKTGEFKDFEYDGITISSIMEKRRSHYIYALRDMNSLLIRKKGTKEYEKWKRIITMPVYYE